MQASLADPDDLGRSHMPTPSVPEMEGEISFDQSERLTARLRDLVRQYPKGPGLVKEFLQNADDAGASKLLVVLDRRTHDSGHLPPDMRAAQGPALLFFNDRVFSEDDFKRIQQVGAGGKVEEAAGTGRFGHGFNTCYSVSDHPSLLTGERVAWFDPHHSAACEDTPQKNARAWIVESKSGRELLPWLRTFSACGWHESIRPFHGTIFRLPLRSAESAPLSEISKEPFGEEDFGEIIDHLSAIGAPLLIFLRSVLELEVREIDPSGRNLLRFSIKTLNATEVDAARGPLRSCVSGKPGELLQRWTESSDPLPIAAFDHHFAISEGADLVREETWAVATGLFSGPDKALLKAALRVTEAGEKAIPWAGAATRTSSSDAAASAGLACFLPLPGATPWPVWIHGWFDLPSNRQGITRSRDAGSANHARYDWNELLMKYGAGRAWALLLLRVTGDPKSNSEPYRLWPGTPSDLDGVDAALVEGLFLAASELPVLRARSRESWAWCKVDDGPCTLDAEWHGKLLVAFSTEGWRVCDPPVPPHIVAGLAAAGKPIPQLTPSAVRAHLSKAGATMELPCKIDSAPLSMLRRSEWIVSIAEFCSEARPSNLSGLPLALKVDRQLDRFRPDKRIYLVPKQAKVLLERLPHRILASALLDALAIKEAVPEIGLRRFDAGELLQTFAEMQFSDPKKKEWLAKAFRFLASCPTAELAPHADQLKAVDWIPDQRGKWHGMGFKTTPLIPGEIQHKLLKILKKLEVPLLAGSDDFVAACAKFSETHSGYLWPLTPTDLADILEAHVEEPFLKEAALDDHANLAVLLDYLSSDSWWQQMKPEQKSLLRKLRILRTQSGARVSANTEHVYLPSGFSPPAGIGGGIQLLDIGQQEKWKPLMAALSVPTLDGATFLQRVLLPVLSDAGLDRALRFTFLAWLRDQHRPILAALSATERAPAFAAIRDAVILPLTGGGLGSPAETYRWGARSPSDVLGLLAKPPDSKFFHKQKELWVGFFAELDLPEHPLPAHILRAVNHWRDIAQRDGAAQVLPQIEKIARYVEENWPRLSKEKLEGNKTLAAWLAELAWLPAHQADYESFTACVVWEKPLWKACELLPRSCGHLAASKHPILGLKKDFRAEIWKGMQGRTTVLVSDVTQHFLRIITEQVGTDPEVPPLKCALAILRWIGSLDIATYGWDLKPLSEALCVPVRGVWRLPSKCFIESIRPAVSGLYSWSDGGLRPDPMLSNGLNRIGVRPVPTVADWIEVLWDLAEQYQDDALPESGRKLFRKIYASLLSFPHESLSEIEVPIVLVDGKLHPGSETFLLDDPRLKGSDKLSEIPLVEDVDETRSLAAIAGATSISSVIKNRLSDSSRLLGNQDDQAKLDEIRATLRSPLFHSALRRLRYQELLDAGDEYQTARLVAESLDVDKVTVLRLRAAETIIVESVAFIEDREITVLESDRKSFHDVAVGQLFFVGGTQRSVKNKIAETISDLLELKAQLKLRDLLDERVERLAEFLDEEGIESPLADIPGTVPNDQDEDQTEWSSDDDAVYENEGAPSQELEGTDDVDEDGQREPSGEARSASDGAEQSQMPRQATPSSRPNGTAPRSERPSISKREYEFGDDPAHEEDGESSTVGGSGAPRENYEPGARSDRRDPLTNLPPRRASDQGSGSNGDSQSSRDSPGGGTQSPDHVFRSKIQRGDPEQESPEIAAQRQQVDRLAINAVAIRLRAAGWEVQEMAHSNAGYDLEVWRTGADSSRCEYWEVKGLSGPWVKWAVTLSATQLDYNRVHAERSEGDRFSLVVVANVGSPNPLLYRIRNPYGAIRAYVLDDAWSELHEPFDPEQDSPQGRPRRT